MLSFAKAWDKNCSHKSFNINSRNYFFTFAFSWLTLYYAKNKILLNYLTIEVERFSWGGLVWFHIKFPCQIIYLMYYFKILKRLRFFKTCHPSMEKFIVTIFTPDKGNRANPLIQIHAMSTNLITLLISSDYFWMYSTNQGY